MTQGWRVGVDTSSLAVRALACAFLLLAVGWAIPKRKAPVRALPAAAFQKEAARDVWEPLRATGVAAGANGQPLCD
jgi:hypothetical protein